MESIRRGDVSGSSFQFQADRKKNPWTTEGKLDVRNLVDISQAPEFGPVVFPAYEGTTSEVRAANGALDEARASYDAWKAEGVNVSARIAQAQARARVIEIG